MTFKHNDINHEIKINFIEGIINGMYDWVRVLDRDDNVIYMNESMSKALSCKTIGMKCFEAVGRTKPCEDCISRKTVFDGNTYQKEEVINNRIYSVMSSPVRNGLGEIIAVVEVLRDITDIKNMQNKILQQNKKLQDDLDIAKRLQCSFLPKELPMNKINFSFIYKPCETIGGDFLDIFKIDEDHIGIYVADVSGHGIPASMLTIFLRSALNKGILSPAQALKDLYLKFNEDSLDNEHYITVFYSILNLRDNSLVYTNAGHNVCPIVFGNNKFEILRSSGIPISNWTDKPEYEDKKIFLSKNDRVFYYTDGIVELKNKMNEQFGEERLLKILLEDTSQPSTVLNRIIHTASEFAGINKSKDIPDDITVALLEIK